MTKKDFIAIASTIADLPSYQGTNAPFHDEDIEIVELRDIIKAFGTMCHHQSTGGGFNRYKFESYINKRRNKK